MKILLLTGLANQSEVKCRDSGAEEVEILSDSIHKLTSDNSWLKPDIYLALARILGGTYVGYRQKGDKYNAYLDFCCPALHCHIDEYIKAHFNVIYRNSCEYYWTNLRDNRWLKPDIYRL